VHESRSTTDEGLVYFDLFTASPDLPQILFMHRQPDSVEHEPSGLLSNSKSACNFVGTDSVLAVRQHPHCDKPFIERDCGIFHDGSDFYRELALGMLLFALPHPSSGDKAHVSAATSGAGNAIGPTALNHEGDAVVRVGKVLDGLLECFWLAHGVLQ